MNFAQKKELIIVINWPCKQWGTMVTVFHLSTFAVPGPVFLWGIPEALRAVTQDTSVHLWVKDLTILHVLWCRRRVVFLMAVLLAALSMVSPLFSVMKPPKQMMCFWTLVFCGVPGQRPSLEGKGHLGPSPTSYFKWILDVFMVKVIGSWCVGSGSVAGYQQSPHPFALNSPYYVWMHKLIYWVFLALANSVILIKHLLV